MRRILLLLTCLILLASCRFPGPVRPESLGTVTTPAIAFTKASALSGSVSFGLRRTQADLDEVRSGATVSLIDTGTDQTVCSGLTDAQGQFTLNFQDGYVADPTTTYYLEAVKGHGSNLPAHDALRVRTIVKYADGWTSLTNTTPNTGIVINPSTTALAIGAGLVNGQPSAFDFGSLIGQVYGPNRDSYAPVTGLDQTDFGALVSLVGTILQDDQDPVANVGLVSAPRTWVRLNVPLAISTLSVSAGVIGASLTLSGTGFSPVSASNIVRFNGVAATLQSASATSLVTSVPAGATSGPLSLQVGNLTILGPNFSVVPVITGFSPIRGLPGASVTLTGSGFDGTNPARNLVLCNGMAVNVTSATGTSLTVTIPQGASSGPWRVHVAGQSATSSGEFEVTRIIQTFAAQLRSELRYPNGVAVDSSGSVYIADTSNHRVLKVSPGTTITVAGNGSIGYSGDDGPATSAQLRYPSGVAVDGSGSLYITDTSNSRIRKVDKDGTITTVAGNGSFGYSGDGGPATSAELNLPYGIAVDGSGNLYFADINNNCIRKVDKDGTITTVAGNGSSEPGDGGLATSAWLYSPIGVAVDGSGSLYFTETNGGFRVRKVSSGIITTVAGDGYWGYSGDGGPATSARIGNSQGIAVDGSGNLYFADGDNNCIRKVSTSGTITTVAGNGSVGYSGDGGPATSAQLHVPYGVAVDGRGDLYIADGYNHCIRIVR